MSLESSSLPKHERNAVEFANWANMGKLSFPGIQLDTGIEGLTSSSSMKVNVIIQGNEEEKIRVLARLLEAKARKYEGVLSEEMDIVENIGNPVYERLLGDEAKKLPRYFCDLDFVFDQRPRAPRPLKSLPLAQ